MPELQRYKDFRPTGFDPAGAFLDDSRAEWLVAPVSQTRDSGPMDESNFAAALKRLGGESRSVEVHRFGHWGPGWFEIIIVSPRALKRVAVLESIAADLENYPLLDEDDFSARESEEEAESWESWARQDFASELPWEFAEDEPTDEHVDALRDIAQARTSRYPEHDSGGANFPISNWAESLTEQDLIATGFRDIGGVWTFAPELKPWPEDPAQRKLAFAE